MGHGRIYFDLLKEPRNSKQYSPERDLHIRKINNHIKQNQLCAQTGLHTLKQGLLVERGSHPESGRQIRATNQGNSLSRSSYIEGMLELIWLSSLTTTGTCSSLRVTVSTPVGTSSG